MSSLICVKRYPFIVDDDKPVICVKKNTRNNENEPDTNINVKVLAGKNDDQEKNADPSDIDEERSFTSNKPTANGEKS